MQPRRKPDLVDRVGGWFQHPYYLLGAATMFFSVALIFSWTPDAHGGRGDEYKQQWGMMVSHALYGLVAFGAGIRGLCLRQPKSVQQENAEAEMGSTTPPSMSPVKFLILAGLVMFAAAAIQWRAGNDNMALLLLAPFPMFLLGWGLSHLLQSPKKRRANANMSSADRARLEEMGREHGKLVGMYFAVPLSLIATLTYLLTDQDARIAGAVFAVGLLISMPISYRLAAPMRNFKAESKSVGAELQPPG